jgi:luciferase family oxidoreductase group 1
MAAMPISVLDLALVGRGETVRQALDGCVTLAQRAEALGYERVWYAEHHNMKTIASSATAVLIAHVAAHTERIRLGSGGVMLPNHAPLTVAEQFGTLAELHPGRIDLGLGRAPGTDQQTFRALRRELAAAHAFPDDVLELQGYLGDDTRVPGVRATPGTGTHVPLYILGSSHFGAQLAAGLGLPYAFASHFAPQALRSAVRIYRDEFRPSAQLATPYVIAGLNVIVADSDAEADEQLQATRRSRVRLLFGRGGRRFSDHEADQVLASPQGAAVDEMLTYTACGTRQAVRDQLHAFAERADADEVIVALQGPTLDDRIRSLELLADAVLAPPGQRRAGTPQPTGSSPASA